MWPMHRFAIDLHFEGPSKCPGLAEYLDIRIMATNDKGLTKIAVVERLKACITS
jgi:hypothetical protein